MGLRNWTNVTTEEKFAMLGNFYEDKREYDKALKCFGKAGNDPEILEKRGEYYYFGKGVEKNISYAKRYFKLAADAGNIEGMYNYACCEKDNEKRYEYCLKAASKGCAQAMNMIGLMILHGEIESDDRAEDWFKKAAENGDEYGARNHAMICR